jgi:hypothetical protein
MGTDVRCRLALDNIGPTLEWYVASLCRWELRGEATWGVKLAGMPAGTDYDVLAWLQAELVYIECKAKSPKDVKVGEIRQFFQRHDQLSPELTIFLVDMHDSINDLVARMEAVLEAALRIHGNIQDPNWPDRPFLEVQEDYPNIAGIWGRILVTNSSPSILAQLRSCLMLYNSRVRRALFLGKERSINFLSE